MRSDLRGRSVWKGVRSALFGGVILPLVTGCYTTSALVGDAPSPGARILADVSDEGARRMAPLIGDAVVQVEARVMEVRPDGWELSVLRVEQAGGRGSFWNSERVFFPEGTLGRVESRELHRIRTAIAVVGGTAAVLLLGRSLGSSGGEPGGGPPDAPAPPN
jgi:hypothetical protein